MLLVVLKGIEMLVIALWNIETHYAAFKPTLMKHHKHKKAYRLTKRKSAPYPVQEHENPSQMKKQKRHNNQDALKGNRNPTL